MYTVCQAPYAGRSMPVALMTREADERGPIAIFWDIENCGIPSDVPAEEVSANMKRSMRTHPETDGAHYRVFSAYGDFALLPKKIREGCQRTGVSLVDVPSGRKDAADRAIMADYFFFAMDNRPPASILLITGDVDFAHSLHKLGARGYQIFLAAPAFSNVSPALLSAAACVWDWPSMARGQGLLPYQPPYHHVPPVPSPSFLPQLRGPPKPRFPLQPPLPAPSAPPAPNFIPSQVMVAMDSHKTLKATTNPSSALPPPILFGRESKSPKLSSPEPPDLSEEERQASGPSLRSGGKTKGKAGRVTPKVVPESEDRFSPFGKVAIDVGSDSSVEVSQRKVGVVTSQLVEVVRKAGGRLPLLKVPSDYRKRYGRPLTLSDYGCSKMFQLVEKMMGVMAIEGDGTCKELILKGGKADKNGSTKKRVSGNVKEVLEVGEVEGRRSGERVRVGGEEGEGMVGRGRGGDEHGDAIEDSEWARDEDTEEVFVGIDRKWSPTGEEGQSAEEGGPMKEEVEEVEVEEGRDLPVILERLQVVEEEHGGAEVGVDRGYVVDLKFEKKKEEEAEEEEEEEEDEEKEGGGVRDVGESSCEKMLDELRRRQNKEEERARRRKSRGRTRPDKFHGFEQVASKNAEVKVQEFAFDSANSTLFSGNGTGEKNSHRQEDFDPLVSVKIEREEETGVANAEVERGFESEDASIEMNLQELLLAYGGRIQIGDVRKAYKTRYGQHLDDSKEAFGSILCRVGDLRTLVDPVSGVDGGKIYLFSR